jgi:drug/metabolite transporter (DMT)-like permease
MTLLAWIGVCLIWSTVWLFIKLGVSDVPPFGFAATRLLLAVGILGPVAAVRRIPFPRASSDRHLIVVTGLLLFSANYALLYWGAQHISSGLMAVLQATTPAFALLIARILGIDERLTAGRVLGLGAGVAGVALIFSDEMHISGSLAVAACAAVVASAFFVASAYVLVRARGNHLHTMSLMVGQMACGAVPLLGLALAREGSPLSADWTPVAVASVFYLAIAGSLVAFWLNYWLLKRIGATRMLLTSILEPLLAVLLGAIVLGERLSERVALGAVCILISLGLVMKRD